MSPLPIEPVVPALAAALRERGAAVLQAPPGAGKTTSVPLALLREPWLAGERIVRLEPRRLAARAAAQRMALMLGERVGDTVGYRMRLDTRVGPTTRLEVVTEGVLARLLREDPALEGTGLVIFDEFHERSLQADLGLALALQSRALLRPELRLLVMSATLEGSAVAALLGGAPVIASEGRAFPVETRWRARDSRVRVEHAAASAVREALAAERGDVLVFLPGAAEIRRTLALLAEQGAAGGADVLPLYGMLPQEAQDRAIAPSPPGARKVVLATSIAETSLTIEGVRVVIDAGLARVPRFSPRTGMTRLETVRVSRASAEQRRGRAGRVAPGVCYRLWGEGEEAQLAPRALPEILEADLAPVVLELAAGGVGDPAELAWLDPPPAASVAQARELLLELGALDAAGRVTPHGRRMAELAMHPRLAHMVLAGAAQGRGRLACELAALLSERDILRGDGAAGDPDLRRRIDALRDAVPGAGVDREARRRVLVQARTWMTQLGAARGAGADDEVEACGAVLALAYPDRVARRRAGARGQYVLRRGAGAELDPAQGMADAEYLVAAELDGRPPRSRIFRAAPITESALLEQSGDQVARDEIVAWDPSARAVTARARERLGAIVLREGPLPHADPARVRAVLVDGIRREGAAAIPWSEASARLRERVAFARALDPSWPDLSDAALFDALDDWLAPHLAGITSLEQLARVDLAAALAGRLGWARRAELDAVAPTHLAVPSGSRIAIDYADPARPVLRVRLQEMFGLAETPRVGKGRVPLTLHLLSPAHRPVQVTADLGGFWRGAYADVRKDLRGRYPRHHWPEDPLQAAPTARAKPRAR